MSSEGPVDTEFLVCYDYGTGGLWGILIAPSQAAISAKYTDTDFHVVDTRPSWMDDAEYQRLRDEPLWLDDNPPQGLLKAVVADRAKARHRRLP